jgi:hypothetical protein
MLGSLPMPLRTISMSAPNLSAKSAIWFMKLMRVANIPLAAYLANSAAAHVHRLKPVVVAHERLVQRPHQQHRTLVISPTMMRSVFM